MIHLINVKSLTAVLVILGVLFLYSFLSYSRTSHQQNITAENRLSADVVAVGNEFHLVAPEHLQYEQPSIVQGRIDVVAVTPWLAPIVWEGTFNPVLLDSIYKPKNITIIATVFAVGKYIMFLKRFLETAEQHFFVGFKVHIYVFTDRPNEVPPVTMASGRRLIVRLVPTAKRWQEISARRMELIQMVIEEQLPNNRNYIFCLDVDSQFHGRWGSESLGGLVAVTHPGYYRDPRSKFPYERRPSSRAYLAPGEGDFYYCGGAFGGLLQEVHHLAKTCRHNFEADAQEGIEAAWQEESHLNRYMWINKPSKVLSPEYLWQDFKPRNPEVHIVRFSGVVKNYADIRPNA
uniref:globoside alpha-1,3-N-acetylgalactosaminyltransferase 1-like isoform X3 n=1 Tax=Gasterosteus aculeatus aculeatus TaxID=481459 RepID=UPI001A98314A|nr:globoside alpha-1,3-N-acetylgalactosaminyltransferase 1-like isoform X3 [Gasterosteus aculeatus aculeatus]